MTKKAGSKPESGSRSICQRTASADPDPHQNGSGTLWFLLTLRDIVSGGVHLDDLDVLVRHLGAQLVIDGGQLLAVPAPRRVELNQHVLARRRNTTIHLKKKQKAA